jgi:hypothetical protein
MFPLKQLKLLGVRFFENLNYKRIVSQLNKLEYKDETLLEICRISCGFKLNELAPMDIF